MAPGLASPQHTLFCHHSNQLTGDTGPSRHSRRVSGDSPFSMSWPSALAGVVRSDGRNTPWLRLTPSRPKKIPHPSTTLTPPRAAQLPLPLRHAIGNCS